MKYFKKYSLYFVFCVWGANTLHAQTCDEPLAERLHQEAQTAIEAGKLEIAAEKLAAAIATCAKAAYYTTDGLLKYRLSDYKGAVEQYTQAMKVGKPTAELHYLRATAYYWLQAKEQARQDYTAAIALNPKHTEAYIGLGVLAEDQEQLKEAMRYYDKAIAAKPAQSLAYQNRGLLYYNEGNQKKALADWNKALAYQPQQHEVRLLRAELFIEQRKYALALQDLDILISQKPYLSEPYLRRGEVYQAQKDLAKACLDWQKSAELGNIEVQKLVERFCK